MAQIKIRIGAERDRSVDATFGSIERRAARTAVLIGKMLNKGLSDGLKGGNARMPGAGGVGGGVRARISAEEKERIASARREDNEKVRLARHRLRLERQEQSFAHKEALRNIRQQEAEKLAGMRRQRREAEATARAAERERRQFAERTSHRATRFMTPNAPLGSMAARAVGDFARGAGVDFSISGSMARAVSLEKQATAISNQGYVPAGTGANAQRVDAATLIAESREIGTTYGVEAATALDALGAFAGVAGDLALGRSLLADMAKLSAATGTELGDMANAAANVSQQLDGLPNQGELIMRVMKMVAGQGKLGAVEMSDLADQMARVASAGGGFVGDRAKNIEFMGALAQMARSKGGAPSAAEASRSVVGFANTFIKGQRVEAFDEAGINVYTDATQRQFKAPQQIIEESLLKTGGNLEKLNALFKDTVAARAVTGAARVFNDAGGGQAGLGALRKEFAKLLEGAAMRDEEIEESARRAKETTAARAARFQNQLDIIVEKTSKDLIPALEKVAPHLLNFAEMLGGIAQWSIENPMHALAIGGGLVTLRAGLESAFRAALERAIMGNPLAPGGTSGSVLAPGTVGGSGDPLAKGNRVVTAVSVIASAEFGYALGKAIAPALWDGFAARQGSEQEKAIQGSFGTEDRIEQLEKSLQLRGGELSNEERTQAEKDKASVMFRLRRADERTRSGDVINGMNDALSYILGKDKKVAQEQTDIHQIGELKQQLAKLEALLSGKLRVEVTNAGDIGPPGGAPANAPQGIVPPPMPGN